MMSSPTDCRQLQHLYYPNHCHRWCPSIQLCRPRLSLPFHLSHIISGPHHGCSCLVLQIKSFLISVTNSAIFEVYMSIQFQCHHHVGNCELQFQNDSIPREKSQFPDTQHYQEIWVPCLHCTGFLRVQWHL